MNEYKYILGGKQSMVYEPKGHLDPYNKQVIQFM